jgi:hypothetical protein
LYEYDIPGRTVLSLNIDMDVWPISLKVRLAPLPHSVKIGLG